MTIGQVYARNPRQERGDFAVAFDDRGGRIDEVAGAVSVSSARAVRIAFDVVR